MPRKGTLRVVKPIEALLGQPEPIEASRVSEYSPHPFSDDWWDYYEGAAHVPRHRAENDVLPHEKFQRETEEHLKIADSVNNGVRHPSILSSQDDKVFQQRVAYCESQGFRRGSVVCRVNDKLVHRMDPSNWGFVLRLHSTKLEHLPKFKPIEVLWCLGVPGDPNYYDEDELIVLVPGLTSAALSERFRKEASRRCSS